MGGSRLSADPGPGPRRRPGGRSARVRAAVLDATFELALECGPAGVTVAEVAERAGVHPTSIYRRWGDREHLLIEALLSRIGEAAPIPDTGSLEDDLRGFLRTGATFMRSEPGTMLLRTAVSMADTAELQAIRDAYWRQALGNATKMFERAAARGEVAPGIDHVAAVEVVAGPLYMRALITGEDLADDFIEQVVRIALDGLRPGRTTVSSTV